MLKTDIIEKVMQPIEKAGFETYFVGGCVRDELLGKEPHDYDIVTNATPVDLHTIFTKFSNVSNNSEAYGVTMPLIQFNTGIEEIEIATFRRDISSGRHPTVVLSDSLAEDAARRDFTCNALYEDSRGAIKDPTGLGLDDIKNRKLRFCGKAQDRIDEDPLRVLRLIRFISKLGFDYEETDNFEVKSLTGVSKERQLKELIGLFNGNDIEKALLFAIDKNILSTIPCIDNLINDMRDTAQTPKWHAEGNVLNHTLGVVREMSKQPHDYIDGFAAFLHDCGKPTAGRINGKKKPEDTWLNTSNHDVIGYQICQDILKELGMSNEDIKKISWLERHHMDAHVLLELKKHNLIKLTSNELFPRLVKLAYCDTHGSIQTLVDPILDADKAIEVEEVKSLIGVPMPKPILTGQDLIEKGYKPGPKFKHALEIAYNHQIDFGILDKEKLFKDCKSFLKSQSK